MNIERPLSYFVLLVIVMALISLPLFRYLDGRAAGPGRHAPLDGLRGVLAFSVFMYHLVVTYRFTATGIWEPPSSHFFALLGPLGVSGFFMITGFLFWDKLLRAKGRPSWCELYIGRLFRIAPMYLFAVLVMLAIVLARTGFELRESAGTVIAAVLQWLALGFVDTQPDVNGYPATHLLAGVTWTIRYEWVFYGSLAITAYVAQTRTPLRFIIAALAFCLAGKAFLNSHVMGFSALFLSGMTVASLRHGRFTLPVSANAASVIALLCIATIFAAPLTGIEFSGFGTPAGLLLAISFYCVCGGASLFGFLTSTAARRLGAVSYSLYLLQGLALTLVFSVAPVSDFAMSGPVNYWTIGALCSCLLTVTACITYMVIEQPGITLGHRMVDRLRRAGFAPPLKKATSVAIPSQISSTG